MKPNKSDSKDMYLDWVNNFHTVPCFSEHYDMTEAEAIDLIEHHRKLDQGARTIKLHITHETDECDRRYKELLSEAVRTEFGGHVIASVDSYPNTVTTNRDDADVVREFVYHISDKIADDLIQRRATSARNEATFYEYLKRIKDPSLDLPDPDYVPDHPPYPGLDGEGK